MYIYGQKHNYTVQIKLKEKKIFIVSQRIHKNFRLRVFMCFGLYSYGFGHIFEQIFVRDFWSHDKLETKGVSIKRTVTKSDQTRGY